MSIQFEYLYGSQAEQFSFYRIPKVLFTDETLSGISVEAKVLYSFMLDRMSLSVKNCWFDEENRVYIIYTIDDILSDFGCARQKALKLLDELENGIGLIERKLHLPPDRGYGVLSAARHGAASGPDDHDDQ